MFSEHACKNICSPRRLIKRGFFSIHVHWTSVETYGQFVGVGRGVNFHACSSKKSIIDLILYDAQNVLPLFSVHYILKNFYFSLLKVITTLHKKKFEELLSGESEEVVITYSYKQSNRFLYIQDFDLILRRRGDHERFGNLVMDLLK